MKDWISGFIAGEGSFFITRQGKYVRPRFCLNLDASDTIIIHKMRNELDGIGTVHSYLRDTNLRKNSPTVYWHISSKQDLLRLVKHLDEYSLRSIKAEDYVVWRKAVIEYIKDKPKYDTIAHFKKELTVLRNKRRSTAFNFL